MERTEERRNMQFYLLFGTAVVAFIFTGVYSPAGPPRRILLPEQEQQVKLSLQPSPDAVSRSRYVVPVKTHAKQQSRLTRQTRYIAEQENDFSGKTTDSTKQQWVRPDRNPAPGTSALKGSTDPLKTDADRGKAPDLDTTRKGNKVSGDSLASYSGQLSEEQKALFKKSLSVFQELPAFRNLNTELLINFSNKGQLSLGTDAFRNAEYFHGMVRKISKKWYQYFPRFQHFYGLLKEGEVLVVFELDLDGKVQWTKLAKSYGQPTLEKSCILAIEGQDFGPIPEEYRQKGKMKIPFLFVYKRPEKPLRMFH